MEDTRSDDTPSKYVVPQLRQYPARKHHVSPAAELPLDSANEASRNFGTGTATTDSLESASSPAADPDEEMAHTTKDTATLVTSAQAPAMKTIFSHADHPQQHPVIAFKKLLPTSLKAVDPDFYLVLFQEQLAVQTKEMTLAARRTGNPPHHLVAPLAYIRALAHTVDRIKQPRQDNVLVTRARKCEQIQSLLDSLGDEIEGASNDNSDYQDDGLQYLITRYDSDLRGQLEALKPQPARSRVSFGTVVILVVVLALLTFSRPFLRVLGSWVLNGLDAEAILLLDTFPKGPSDKDAFAT
ncbi:hypothetical protein AYO20_04816 [Fonsecaea nubica]|uniref:Uncharacterized protein n=1 Tax=Fonsecaea nubica TaxID=856822 RepID=A0A178D171_9EURO|nr:hypothetical protein AYO20_04816 [Fonsecaea nubica]OAL35910.1 hypothetical protein AYO20_04816 [Fonsecaea nubica]